MEDQASVLGAKEVSSPKTNTENQAAYAVRQRQLGRIKKTWWLTPEEGKVVGAFIQKMRTPQKGTKK